MIYLLVLAYTIWAVYSGYKVVSGRSEWLDKNSAVNRMVKAITCLLVGYIIGVFYLLYLIVRMLFR